MGKTIVEKILAKAAGNPEISPDEYVKLANKYTFIQISTDRLYTAILDNFREAWVG